MAPSWKVNGGGTSASFVVTCQLPVPSLPLNRDIAHLTGDQVHLDGGGAEETVLDADHVFACCQSHERRHVLPRGLVVDEDASSGKGDEGDHRGFGRWRRRLRLIGGGGVAAAIASAPTPGIVAAMRGVGAVRAMPREENLPAGGRDDEEQLVTRVLFVASSPGGLCDLELDARNEQARGRRAAEQPHERRADREQAWRFRIHGFTSPMRSSIK